MIDTAFKYNLSETEKQSMISFYNSLPFVTVEQHPEWLSMTEKGRKLCYFLGTENGKLVSSAVIEESRKLSIRYASVHFGPLFSDNDAAVESIIKIQRHYRNLGFAYLTIQPGFPTGPEADYIEYRVSRTIPFSSFFDRNNWSSIVVDLSNDEELLKRNMSKGHKSDLKKAIKEELSVTDNFSDEQFNTFIDIYTKMHRERGLKENEQGSAVFLGNLRHIFNTENLGKFLLVKNATGQILGGVVIVFQNKTVRYFKGAADPAIRNLPVLHLAIWEAITRSKQEGFEYFDLWGYNHFVDESDQIYFINRFKKGFGGYFIFYPKKMYFFFKPLQYKALNFAQKVYQKIK